MMIFFWDEQVAFTTVDFRHYTRIVAILSRFLAKKIFCLCVHFSRTIFVSTLFFCFQRQCSLFPAIRIKMLCLASVLVFLQPRAEGDRGHQTQGPRDDRKVQSQFEQQSGPARKAHALLSCL